jgi:beta-galactosidase GanA
MVESSGIHPLSIDLPKGVDLYVRSRSGKNGESKTVWILVNFGKDVGTVSLPGQMTDVLGSGRVGSVKLEPYGVAVLSKD